MPLTAKARTALQSCSNHLRMHCGVTVSFGQHNAMTIPLGKLNPPLWLGSGCITGVTAEYSATNLSKVCSNHCELVAVLVAATAKHCRVCSHFVWVPQDTLRRKHEHCKARINSLRMHCSALDGNIHGNFRSNYLWTSCSALTAKAWHCKVYNRYVQMHYKALDGKGNDKHWKVQSDYPRMHYSALDGPAHYGRLRSSYQLSTNALQCF